jgi:capsule polysaccharide export protein KpsE/RkpR
MTTITFDTHEMILQLRGAGFEEKQAETIVRVILESQERLLTREYFDARMLGIDAKFESIENRIILRIGALIVVAVGILMAYLPLVIK